MKTTRSRKHSKDQAILVSLAESIGSTLGSIAAKADATQKALTKRKVATNITRKGKAIVRKGKRMAGNLKKTKLGRASRRISGGRPARRRSGRK